MRGRVKRSGIFGATTSAANRPLPLDVYEGKGRFPTNIGLREVKAEIKALIDIMDKRYKASIKAGVEHDTVAKYERGQWKTAGKVRTVREGLQQIRQMWQTLTKVKTAPYQKIHQEMIWRKEYEALIANGRLILDGKPMDFDSFHKFREFFAIYAKANKGTYYYVILSDFSILQDEQVFKKMSIQKLIDRWEKWQKLADEVQKDILRKWESGEFVNGDAIRNRLNRWQNKRNKSTYT